MGLFKQIKDSKTLLAATPGIFEQANQMGESAKAMQVAQEGDLARMQAALAEQQAAVGPTMTEAQSAPISGVDLTTYAWVVKQIAPLGYDQSLLPGFAAQRGVSAADWQTAMDGWAIRIEDPAVAASFRRLYDAS